MRLVSAIYNDHYPFDKLQVVKDLHNTSNPAELKAGDILVVWGGQDISPSLYNKAKSKRTWADEEPSYRDRVEWSMMKRAVELEIPIIGICRG